MKLNQLRETIRKIVTQVLNENKPATTPSKPSPGPKVAPGKPDTGKPKPRRPLGNPNVKPAPKALKEEEILNKIVKRFKSNSKINEMGPFYTDKDGKLIPGRDPEYKKGYRAGYEDASSGKNHRYKNSKINEMGPFYTDKDGKLVPGRDPNYKEPSSFEKGYNEGYKDASLGVRNKYKD